jgi:hypothetical protein
MRYKVTFAQKAIMKGRAMSQMPFIPETEREVTFDTDSGPGQSIWTGYLQMRGWQQEKPLRDDDWRKIRVPADANPANEIHKFREALNLFMRYSAGDGASNCDVVKDIQLIK